MDAFELIIGQLLEEEKYWVRLSVKINLSPNEKRTIKKPSTPRPEIDIAAYDVNSDTVYLFEVKSFHDSPAATHLFPISAKSTSTLRRPFPPAGIFFSCAIFILIRSS